jgi:hypothetical protein
MDLKMEAQRETGDAGKASQKEQNTFFAAGFAADVRGALTYVRSSLSPANFIFYFGIRSIENLFQKI